MLVSRLILGLVAASMAVTCMAQDNLSIGSVIDSEQIKQMLESDKPRLVAWGAYFASRSNDALNRPVFATVMTRRIAQWGAQPRRTQTKDVDDAIREGVNSERQKAVGVVLYSLIETGESVPIGSLIPIATEFRTESLILAARLPTDELTPFLQYWCEKNNWMGTADENWRHTAACTPVAAMLLARTPPPGFAASVLKQSSEDLSFRVLNGDQNLSKMKRHGTRHEVCQAKKEDETIPIPPELPENIERELAQWPPLFTYQLQNSASPYPGTLLVDAGGLAVTYRRIPAFTRPTGCFPPPGEFDEDFKYHLLAEMLGVDDEAVGWPVRQDVAFFLHNPAGFLPALKMQIEREESAFRQNVEALEDKGYLTKEEAAIIRPKLQVTVIDARESAAAVGTRLPPLPDFESKDPLISVAFSNE